MDARPCLASTEDDSAARERRGSDYKLTDVVLGPGTARAAPAGGSVAIVDERPFGGTCASRGCDPKKVLVQAAERGERYALITYATYAPADGEMPMAQTDRRLGEPAARTQALEVPMRGLSKPSYRALWLTVRSATRAARALKSAPGPWNTGPTRNTSIGTRRLRHVGIRHQGNLDFLRNGPYASRSRRTRRRTRAASQRGQPDDVLGAHVRGPQWSPRARPRLRPPMVPHAGHVDYLVDGHLDHPCEKAHRDHHGEVAVMGRQTV